MLWSYPLTEVKKSRERDCAINMTPKLLVWDQNVASCSFQNYYIKSAKKCQYAIVIVITQVHYSKLDILWYVIMPKMSVDISWLLIWSPKQTTLNVLQRT